MLPQRIFLYNKQKGIQETHKRGGTYSNTKNNALTTTAPQHIKPIQGISRSKNLGFEIGSVYQCLMPFKYRYGSFEENEILEVIGNMRAGGCKDTEIIFVNLENSQKKFWTLKENEKELAKGLFQRIN
jgi:hypothetical protein